MQKEISMKRSNQLGPFLPEPFVDRREIDGFFDLVDTGAAYLRSIMPDLNDNPFAQAVEAYLNNLDQELAEVQKSWGECPTIFNSQHPAITEMFQAASEVAAKAQEQRTARFWEKRPS